MVLLLGPVPGYPGGLEPPFGRRAVLPELAQAVAQPPLGLHHGPVAVRLGGQVRQSRLQHLGGLGPPAQPQQQPTELLPRPGAERGSLTGLVGPVRRLQGVLRRLRGPAEAVEHLGEPEVQLRPSRGLQVCPAVLQGRAQRPFGPGRIAQMVGEGGQPGLVLHREPGQPGADVPRHGLLEQLGGRREIPGACGGLREHRPRLGRPGGESYVRPVLPAVAGPTVPGPTVLPRGCLDERQHLPRGRPRGGQRLRRHRPVGSGIRRGAPGS